jgi:hypothetical protein
MKRCADGGGTRTRLLVTSVGTCYLPGVLGRHPIKVILQNGVRDVGAAADESAAQLAARLTLEHTGDLGVALLDKLDRTLGRRSASKKAAG